MGGGGWVDHQRLHIRHIGQQGENLQAVDKFVSFSLASLDLKGEDGCAAVGEIFLVQCVVGVVGQGWVVDLLHLGMAREELHHLFGVLGVALQP